MFNVKKIPVSGITNPVEINPSFRTIRIRNRKGKTIKRRLAFPYMQFCIVRGTPVVTWSMESINNVNGKVSIPLLPNVYPSGRVCMGGLVAWKPIDFCDNFWNSTFTPYEYTWYYNCWKWQTFSDRGWWRIVKFWPNMWSTKLRTFSRWERLSNRAKNPMDVFKRFSDYRFRLGDVIASSTESLWRKKI